MQNPNATPARRSRWGLDLVNFFIADVETGVGPLLATFLSSAHNWKPGQIGLIIGAQKFAGVLGQTPAGWLIDWVSNRTLVLSLAIAAISFGCLFIVVAQSFAGQLANQVLVGLAVTLVAPAIAAITLGIFGKDNFSARAGRNATFSHGGNLAMASVTGVVSHQVGPAWIFYLCALMGGFAIVSALAIRRQDVDEQRARALASQINAKPVRVIELAKDSRVLWFSASVVLFHVANSAMLPLAGQQLAHLVHREASTYMAAAIVVSQLAMVPTSYLCGRWTDWLGRKPLFLFAFACLIARGMLFAFVSNPGGVLGIEFLDGLGTASSGVLTTITASDLAQSTGRFNLLGGALQTAISLGALAGNISGGFVAQSFGYSSAFLYLTITASVGAVLYLVLIPETRIRETDGKVAKLE